MTKDPKHQKIIQERVFQQHAHPNKRLDVIKRQSKVNSSHSTKQTQGAFGEPAFQIKSGRGGEQSFSAILPPGRYGSPIAKGLPQHPSQEIRSAKIFCQACRERHFNGSCPLKTKPLESCPLCGLAHFGNLTACPHLQDEVQIRLMLDALRKSHEPKAKVDALVERLRKELYDRAALRKATRG